MECTLYLPLFSFLTLLFYTLLPPPILVLINSMVSLAS
jgi:hypothetical protein